MRVSQLVTKGLLDYYFKIWGAASGCYTTRPSSKFAAEDIIQVAKIGLAWALEHFDPEKKTAKGEPVNLKSWCILIMRSRVNACRAKQVWLKDRVIISNSELVTLLTSASSAASVSGVYPVLETLVEREMFRRSKEHGIIFGLLVHEGLAIAEISKLLKLSIEKVKNIQKQMRPVVLNYSAVLQG